MVIAIFAVENWLLLTMAGTKKKERGKSTIPLLELAVVPITATISIQLVQVAIDQSVPVVHVLPVVATDIAGRRDLELRAAE